MTTIAIPIETLEKWQKTLDNPKLPKNACFTVSEEMFDLLQQAPRQAKQEEQRKKKASLKHVPFADITPGDDYEIFNVSGVKYAPLNGKKCKVFQKNRTRVVVRLLEDASDHFKKDHKVTVYPSHLREIQN